MSIPYSADSFVRSLARTGDKIVKTNKSIKTYFNTIRFVSGENRIMCAGFLLEVP